MSKRTSHRHLWPSEIHRSMSAEDVALAGPEVAVEPRGCVAVGCIQDEQTMYVTEDLPLCHRHFASYLHTYERKGNEVAARVAAKPDSRVVYYIRFADHIKIGRSASLISRMHAMHVHRSALLAVEPGDHRVELQRHYMFADERVGRTELFEPSPRLLEHIEHVRSVCGDPEDFLPAASPYVFTAS